MIYKIISAAEWQNFQRAGVFAGSPVDLADGFIHFSTTDLIAETAAKHFAGRDGLWLLEVDEQQLGDDLKYEPSRRGQSFPHLYAELHLDQICRFWQLPWDAKPQIHRFPKEMIACTEFPRSTRPDADRR